MILVLPGEPQARSLTEKARNLRRRLETYQECKGSQPDECCSLVFAALCAIPAGVAVILVLCFIQESHRFLLAKVRVAHPSAHSCVCWTHPGGCETRTLAS